MPTMISGLEEETLDLDWFAVDGQGEIGHFATGGKGFLPPSVKASKENQSKLNAFFRKLTKNGEAIESPILASHVQFQTEAEANRYLEDYSYMAGRGLYSFDCFIARRRPTSYFLVARPSDPLTLEDLPKDIREVVRLTQFRGSFSKLNVIQESAFLLEHITKQALEYNGRFERT
jgi:hypothetical protein